MVAMPEPFEATDVISRGSKSSPVSIVLIVLLVVSVIILFISYSPLRVSLTNTVSGKTIQESTVITYTSMGRNFSQIIKTGSRYYQKNVTMTPWNNNCRNGMYPRTADIYRFNVPTELVPWEKEFKNYKPVDYTAPVVLSMPEWADVEVRNTTIQLNFNQLDGKVDRISSQKKYDVINGVPRNPIGRTGVCGRGLLGRWGPNHAADPIVTRWKMEYKQRVKGKDGRNILQFIAIQRHDTGDWALPGGMVDPGEFVPTTLQREFSEEALNIEHMTEEERNTLNNKLKELFHSGKEIYRGYVDDIRNTDNAWIETVAMYFHDEIGSTVGNLTLHAGDDAARVKWMDVSSKLNLYASHRFFLEKVSQELNASW